MHIALVMLVLVVIVVGAVNQWREVWALCVCERDGELEARRRR